MDDVVDVPDAIGLIGVALIRPRELHAAVEQLRAAAAAVDSAGCGEAFVAARSTLSGVADAMQDVLCSYLRVDGVAVPAGWERQ